MSDVRAKFFVSEVVRSAHGGNRVIMSPATRGAVNASFASATPSGRIELTVQNEAAFVVYAENVGREFYVDFTLYHPEVDDGHKFIASPEGHYNHPRCAECGGLEEAHK